MSSKPPGGDSFRVGHVNDNHPLTNTKETTSVMDTKRIFNRPAYYQGRPSTMYIERYTTPRFHVAK